MTLVKVARYLAAMNMQRLVQPDKFRAYRARKKASGLREIRIWVPDLRNPDVLAQIKCENDALKGHKSESDAADFIETIMAEDPEFYI